MEQRKKGTKPPFFRNTSQGQPTLKEPIMTEPMGGYQGNHIFNVGVVEETTCIEIALTEVKK